MYQLAYDRYQEKGNRLYQTYQTWADLEQQTAQQEQWEQEYELEERKRQDAHNRFLLEQESKNSQTQNNQTQTGTTANTSQPDYWAMLAYYRKLGQNTQSQETTAEPAYDNGKVSEGNIKTMQRVLGLKETGKWTETEHQKAGNLSADDAWLSYQKGQLQNRNSHGQWEQGTTVGNIKTMERVLGLEEDGYWSEEDKKAAGGLTAFDAWKNYQQGKLQSRSKSGMSMDEWADLKKQQSQSSGFHMEETTHAVREFIGQMMTKEQASKRGITSKEWEAMVFNPLNHVKLSAAEFRQLELYYGLDVAGGMSLTADTEGSSAQKMSYTEYREKTAPQKIDDLNAEIQQYFRDYQAFANSAVYDLQNAGYQNAASMQESRIQTATDLDKRADILLTSLRTSGDIISGDYSELLAQISSMKKDIDSIMDALGGKAKYYSQWETEEDYNEAVQAQKEYESMLALDLDVAEREVKVLEDILAEYDQLILRQSTADPASDANVRLREIRNQYGSKADLKDLISQKRAYLNRAKRLQEGAQLASVVNNDDFEYYSALGAAIQNPSLTDAEGYFNFFGWRPGSEEVGNIVTYSRDNYANIAAMSEGGKYDVVGDLRYKDMTDEEVAIYNYLLAKEGKARAGKFLSYIEEDLNARIGKRTADQIASIDIPVIEELVTGLYGFGAGIDQWISGTRQLFTKEQIPTTITQYANSEIADSLDGIGKYAYTSANVIGNMAPSILLSYVTAGVGAPAAVAQGVGAAAVGMTAAGNAYGSALRDGYSIEQARAYSTLVGVAEGTLQYILGGIGSLGGVTDDLIKAKINMIDNSLLRISAKLGVDVFSEIGEEELQNYLEPAFRSIIFGEEYDAPTIDEMLETAIVTAGTTLLLGGGDTISNDLRESGQLNSTVQTATNQTNTTINPAEVAESLKGRGIPSWKIDTLAEAIIGRVNDQKLTRTQRDVLLFEQKRFSVQNIISKFINNSKATTEQHSPEQHEGQDKAGSTWENGEMSERTYEQFSASSKEIQQILGVDDSQGLKREVNRSIIEIQNGFACFPEGDSLNDNAKMVPPLDGFFDVAMHGTPRNVEFRLAENKMNARTLAIIIRHSKGYTGQNIRLLSCNTGKVVGESYCFAEELANALGVTVSAPNKALYIFPDGRLRVGKYGDGEFINYKPNQRRRLR